MDSRSPASCALVPRNTAALAGAQAVSALATLLTAPFLFAALGAHRFGIWALLLAVVAVWGLTDLGLGSAQVREVAQATSTGDRRREQAALGIGLVFYGALGAALLAALELGWDAFVAVFHVGAFASEARTAALLLVAAFCVDALSTPWRAALQGRQLLGPVALATSASAVLGAALGVALVAGGAGLAGLGWGALAASVLRGAIVVGTSRRVAPDARPRLRAIRYGDVRAVLGYGVRVQGTNTAFAASNDSGRLLLGALLSPAAVAPFDLGAKLAGAIRLLPSHALTAFFPVPAALHARDERALLDHLYLRATRYLALFGCLTGAALVASAGPLVELWLGRPLPAAAATVALLSAAYAVNIVSGAAAATTRAEGRPGRETRYMVLVAALNVGLAIPLVLALGTVGMPLATSLAYVVGTTYFFWHFHRASGRPLAPLASAVWKPCAAAGAGLAAAWAAGALLPDVSGRLEAGVAAGARAGIALAVAAIALAALRFFDDADRALVRRAAERLGLSRSHALPEPVEGGRAW